jgi:hypothetical protein
MMLLRQFITKFANIEFSSLIFFKMKRKRRLFEHQKSLSNYFSSCQALRMILSMTPFQSFENGPYIGMEANISISNFDG